MTRVIRAELEQLGLSEPETQVYLVLVENPSRSASSIADATGLSRTSVYQMLGSLADKGLIEAGAGYGSRFSVLPPEEALTSLVVRERAMLAERERIARSVGQQLASLLPATEAVPEELIQVVRNPKVIAERYNRLQIEAQHEIQTIVRAPILNPRRDNPVQQEALRRGVRVRGLYEREATEQPEIKPFLKAWVAAGEEARVYGGKLPHKLAIFDHKVVLLPLAMPGDQMRALLIRHRELAVSLSIMFETFWEEAQPIQSIERKSSVNHRRRPTSREHRAEYPNSNGRSGSSRELGRGNRQPKPTTEQQGYSQ